MAEKRYSYDDVLKLLREIDVHLHYIWTLCVNTAKLGSQIRVIISR